jgi:hypothetical protein
MVILLGIDCWMQSMEGSKDVMNQRERTKILKQFLREIRRLAVKYPRLTHTWRFATSAVWAMGKYYEADVVQPPPKTPEDAYIVDTKMNLDALIANKSLSQDWDRGFWFNATIMRLDAIWERLFKFFLPPGIKCDGPSLYILIQERRARPVTITYQDSSFGRVRKIVNQLKHEPGGAKSQIRESRELPMEMFNDLLDVIQDRAFIPILRSKGKGSVMGGN